MATAEVVSAKSAFQVEKVEEPIKTHDESESNTVKETETAVPEPTPEEPVKETETAVAEPTGKPAAEAEALAAEVEVKVVVNDADEVNLQDEPVGGETAKVAPEPEPEPESEPAVEETAKEAEPETDDQVNAEEAAEPPADSEAASKPAGEVKEEKVGDEAEAITEKSDE